jgi:hypothetical protein
VATEAHIDAIALEIADYVKASWPHGSATASCTKDSYSVYLHRYGSCEIGSSRVSLSDAMAKAIKAANAAWPDERTARKRELEEARDRLARAEAAVQAMAA